MGNSDKSPGAVTLLLRQARKGDRRALEQLVPLVYDELRRLASHHMQGERRDHTLQATALVHEAYARLIGTTTPWEDRAQFFKAAAGAMKRVLVDHARARNSAKRGGDLARMTLEGLVLDSGETAPDILELDLALKRFRVEHRRSCDVVELHFFGGLSYDEIARVIEFSPATVDRDMRFGRAWLKNELSSRNTGG
jgi:RNA polymerase sigma factor (TIGR02999 family)